VYNLTVEMLIIIPVDNLDLDSACNELADFIKHNFKIDSTVIISAQILQKKVVIRSNGSKPEALC